MDTSPQGERAPENLAAPRLTLPKGGGALRGIDEKFTSNGATGMGSIRIPIVATAGRCGFGPQMTLAYNSGSGNGPFGIGWMLSTGRKAHPRENVR